MSHHHLTWRSLPQEEAGGDSSPGTRSSHALAVTGSNIYVFGGERTPRCPVDDKLYCYDLGKEQWLPVKEPVGPHPSPRVAPALAPIGTVLYLFGGRQGIEMGEGALDELWRVDVSKPTLEWEKVEVATGPMARSFHQMVSDEGKLYVFGGCSKAGRLSDLWRFDPATTSWEEVSPTAAGPKGRGGAAVAVLEGGLYVIAGFIGEEVNDVWRLDLASRTWKEVSPNGSTSLTKRSVMGVARWGSSKLVAFGGEAEPSARGHEGAGRFLGDTCAMEDASTGQFVTLPRSKGDPTPRGWYAYGSPEVSSDVVMVVSGGLYEDGSRLDDLYILEVHPREA